MKVKIIVLLLIGVLISGCVSWGYYLKTDNFPFELEQTDPANIEIYATDKTGREYKPIGLVIASVPMLLETHEAVEYLKTRAARMGADAVINMKFELQRSHLGQIVITGTAVKFNEKIN